MLESAYKRLPLGFQRGCQHKKSNSLPSSTAFLVSVGAALFSGGLGPATGRNVRCGMCGFSFGLGSVSGRNAALTAAGFPLVSNPGYVLPGVDTGDNL